MLSYDETLDFVYKLEVERMDLKLERVADALALCGNPQQRFPSLHVAGTNGKGSTAAFLHATLSAAGYHVGLFTSPHLVDFCERIRLGARWIRQQEVIEGVAAIRECTDTTHIQLTPFEMMTVLAFTAFADAHVDIAVVEVGLGGRLDATNVLSPLVSLITGIGLDHQAYLGSTLADIAREKGGIIKAGVPVVVGKVDDESLSYFRARANELGSSLYAAGQDFAVVANEAGILEYHGLRGQLTSINLGLRGSFQRNNAAVALATLELVHSSFPVTDEQKRQGLATVRWPGRLEIVSRQPFVIVDGAHNPQAMATLVAELPALLAGRRMRLLFGVMRDKDWRTMIPLIACLAHEVVVTRVQQPRAEDPVMLRAAFAPFCPVRVNENAREACRELLTSTGANEAVVIAGSLFLVGEVYPLFSSATVEAASPGYGEDRA